jgi:hypothetical protein
MTLTLETICGESVEVDIQTEDGSITIKEVKERVEASCGIDRLTIQIYRAGDDGSTPLPDESNIDTTDSNGTNSLVLMVVGEMVCVRIYSRSELVAATADTTVAELLAQLSIQYDDGEILFKGQLLPQNTKLGDHGVKPRIIPTGGEAHYEKGCIGLFGNPQIRSSTLHYVIPDKRFY